MEPVTLPNILIPNLLVAFQNKKYKQEAVELSLKSVRECESALHQAIANRLESFSVRQAGLNKKLVCLQNHLDSVGVGAELSYSDKNYCSKICKCSKKRYFLSHLVRFPSDLNVKTEAHQLFTNAQNVSSNLKLIDDIYNNVLPSTPVSKSIISPSIQRTLTPSYTKRIAPLRAFVSEIEPEVSLFEPEVSQPDKAKESSDSELDLPELSDDDENVFDIPEDIPPVSPQSEPVFPPVSPHGEQVVAPPPPPPLPTSPPPPLPSSSRIELSMSSNDTGSDRDNLLMSIRNLGGFKGAKLQSTSKRVRRKSKEPPKAGNSEDFMASLTRRLSTRRTAIEPSVSKNFKSIC